MPFNIQPIREFVVRPALPPQLSRMSELAYNILWAWQTSIRALFRDEQRRILNVLCDATLSEAESTFRALHERYDPLMRFHAALGVPLPRVLRTAAEFDVNMQLRRLLENDDLPLAEIGDLLREARDERVLLDETTLMTMERTVERTAAKVTQRPDAIDLLARAIEADPNFTVAYYAQGVVHQELGNRWKAASQFRAAIQLDPNYPEPHKALGDLFLAAPRRLFEQAVESYAKAIDLRPFYGEAYVGLGEAKAAKGDIDGAIGAYTKALAYNPINPRVHMSLGKIYYSEKGLYYESVTAYKKAIDLDPNSVDARMGLGEVYEDKGLYKEAMEEYRRVIDLDGKHTGAMYNLALVYEKVDPKEAVAQWERYIGLASQLPSEKDWVDVARQHLRKLKSQIKD